MLSSLQGAAITSLRVNGVLHEFSTIPGVMEDVSDIVLNLKEVRLRLHADGPKTLRLHKKGEGLITAADLASEDSSIEILNKDHKIATLSSDADVEMEVTIGVGKGYVPAEKNKTPEMAIGTIPIDSVFSPVTKINYTVTPARVGRETDFDRLNFEVWTDGTVSPMDAVAFAAKILKEQLSIFINFDEPVEMPDTRDRRGERPPIRISSSRSTSSSCRCAPRIACRTPTSVRSASSSSGPRPRCSRPRTSAASRSTRSRRCSSPWASSSA